MTTHVPTVGILGIGHLAGFIIEGAARAGVKNPFVLSPRSHLRATELAARYGATVAPDNQAVVDACDMLLVCLPAAQGAEVLAGLKFRSGQSVLSAMAGLSQADLSQIIAPARGYSTMMPGHANALGQGPSLLYPPDPQWHDFLSSLGPVIPIKTADVFEAATVFGGFSGATFAFMAEITAWFEAKGLPADLARNLVAQTLRGNAAVVASSDLTMAEISNGVATPGGITEKCVTTLEEAEAIKAWSKALDAVLEKIRSA